MLYVWFGTFLLHNLSRVLPIYPALVAAAALGALLAGLRRDQARDVAILVVAAWAMTAYVIVVDVSVEGALPSFANVVRLLTPAVALTILLLTDIDERALRRLSSVFVLVVALAALSMVYQVINGPIDWFAEASERAGVQRYASLLGSLTVLGTAAPIGLLAAAMYVRRPAGFIVLLPFMLPLIERGTRIRLGLTLAGLAALTVALVPAELLEYAGVGWDYFLSAGTGGGSDVGLSQSAIDRLTALPREVVQYHGLDRMLFGVGLRGGSGVFGFSDLPMAHNGIVDYLAIGGVPYLLYGLLLLGMMFLGAYRVVRWRAHIEDGSRVALFVSGLAVLYAVNVPFASGLGFHPAFSWIPPLVISFAYSVRARSMDDLPLVAHSSS